VSFKTRIPIIEKIESLRGSKVICYVTSLRPNAVGLMADDSAREFIEHLQRLPQQPIEKLDLFLASNGGDGVVPWRLVPIFREYAKQFNVLVPFKAYSAATIMALGANEIVMHKFGALGPIDPTVTNEFNPVEANTNRKLGISVEDVKAYVSFIKDTVGIKHEEELVRTIEILARKVHPLALGNVERFISQSRMIARKLLLLHTSKSEEHTLDGIIEELASKLFFHGHPINRTEAKALGLKVLENVPAEIETAMWELFADFESEFLFREHYDPLGKLLLNIAPNPGIPGRFVELARSDETVTWVRVESSALPYFPWRPWSSSLHVAVSAMARPQHVDDPTGDPEEPKVLAFQAGFKLKPASP
jgi:hypothetical protein